MLKPKLIEDSFPLNGVHVMGRAGQQPPGTCSDCLNVLPVDSVSGGGRLRGGSRPGVSKFNASAVNGTNPIQNINHIVATPQRSSPNPTEVLYSTTSGNRDWYGRNLDLTASWTENDLGSRGMQLCVKDWQNRYFTIDGGAVAATAYARMWTGTGGSLAQQWETAILHTAGGSIYDCQYDPVRDRLIVCSNSYAGKNLRSLDAATGAEVWGIETNTGGSPRQIAIDSAGNIWLAQAGATKTVLKVNGADGSAMAYADAGTAYPMFGIDIKVSGGVTYVLASSSKAGTRFGVTDKNLYCWSVSGSTLTLEWSTLVDCGTTYSYLVDCMWHPGDGHAVALGQYDAGTAKVLWKINSDTQVEMDSVNLGKGYSDGVAGRALDIIADASSSDYLIFAAVPRNNTWTGAGGNAQLFQVTDASSVLSITATGDPDGTNAFGGRLSVSQGDPPPPTGRVDAITFVSAGEVFVLRDGTLAQPTGGDLPMANAAIDPNIAIMSQAAFGVVYFLDGLDYMKYSLEYDSGDDSVSVWAPTAGSMPDRATMIALYRGRIVLSGVGADPHNWFMSKAGDPLDWDYADTTATAAVAGNNSEAGKIGDVVTCLMPYGDDMMIVAGDHTLWVMRGDPAAGSVIDNISMKTGIVGRFAAAYDPAGTLYFLGAGHIWRMQAGGAPESLSVGRIDSVISGWDLSAYDAMFAWDVIRQGLHVFLRPSSQPASGAEPTHLFWDQRTDSFWFMSYPYNIGPSFPYPYDSDLLDDRALILGGWDSYLRELDSAATMDDGSLISSYVDIGPIVVGDSLNSKLTMLRTLLASGSSNVNVSVYAGETAEAVMAATVPVYTEQQVAGANAPIYRRVNANAIKVRIAGLSEIAGPWSVEGINAMMAISGRRRTGRL